MCRKLNFLMFFVLALSIAVTTTYANLNDGLVVLHTFDDLFDGSDNGLDLILEGDAEVSDGFLWLDGDGDWADVGSLEDFGEVNPCIDEEGEPSDFTIVIAYATEDQVDPGTLLSIGPELATGSGDLSLFSSSTGLNIDHWWVGDAPVDIDGLTDGDVHWIIITHAAEEGYRYYLLNDGEITQFGDVDGAAVDYALDDEGNGWNPVLDYGCRLGYFRNETLAIDEAEFWTGWIECQIDHFAMWSRVLDEEEMTEVVDFGGGSISGKAGGPDPGDEDDFVLRDVELSWKAGPFAATHNVYFGTDFDDVNEADTDSDLLVSSGNTETTYTPEGLLDWGQTYYWRVDEINDADPNSPWKGNTWSFTVEPYNFALNPEGAPVLDETENPFIADLYAGRSGAAFQAQLFSLLARHRQQSSLRQTDLFSKVTVSDYLFDKDKIYAYLNLDDNELFIYQRLYDLLATDVIAPDLVVYLQTPTAVLCQRARVYRQRIAEAPFPDDDYLGELNEAYTHFFYHYSATPLLVVDTSQFDLEWGEAALDDLVKQLGDMGRGTRYYVPRTGPS